MKCPGCDREMALVDKHTFTGEEIREFHCKACNRNVIERGGIALWQALSDAREENEKDRPPDGEKK